MNPKLEELLINKLSSKGVESSPQSQMQTLFSQLEEQSKLKKIEAKFEQLMKGSGFESGNTEMNQSLKTMFSTDRLVRLFGMTQSGAISGILAGFLQGLNVQGFGISGLPSMLAGWLGTKYIGKSGKPYDFFEGVFDAGLVSAISGFTKNLSIGGILGGGSSTTSTTSQYAE